MKQFEIETDKLFTNITGVITELIPEGFSGVCSVFTPHTTAGIAALEDEILHHADIRFFLDTFVPKDRPFEGPQRNTKYLHDMISLRKEVGPDERVNGHSHLRSLFFSSSESIPVSSGALVLGPYKQLFFVELDPIRTREIYVSFLPGI